MDSRFVRVRRVFCWWPVRVYSFGFPQPFEGWRWLRYAWRDPEDGKHYITGATP